MATTLSNPVQFREAIDFFKAKVQVPTKTWTDIWQGMHSPAFVVAGATNDKLLSGLFTAVQKGIEDGTTLTDFRRDFDKIVQQTGWSYKGGRGWRTKTIFETNMGQAYSAGRWAQVQEQSAQRPWVRYVAVMDGREREEHAAWHNTIVRHDDPWLDSHTPLNGWGCRCSIQSLGDDDLQSLGLDPKAPPKDGDELRSVNTPDGKIQVTVPTGIDPGFDYNPGKAGGAGLGSGPERKAFEEHGDWKGLQVPWGPKANLASLPKVPVDKAKVPDLPRPHDGSEAALKAHLRTALGGDEAYFSDPRGQVVKLSSELASHLAEKGVKDAKGRARHFGQLPELITDPFEIWAGFAVNSKSGRVAIRRRYVKLIEIEEDGKKRAMGLVADLDNGHWSGVTFVSSKTFQKTMRGGQLIYRRSE